MKTGELFAQGKYLEAVEMELYQKFLDMLDADNWEGCSKVVQLLEGLSII